MTQQQATIWNRTEMHSGVRGATELLQQEVGQAGRIALPATIALTGGVASGSQTVAVGSTAGIFAGERLIIDTGATEEPVTRPACNPANAQITAPFLTAHTTGR